MKTLLIPASYSALQAALEKRIAIIADTSFREHDPAGHLAAIREAAQTIDTCVAALDPKPPAELNHYLTGQSYSKALDWILTVAPTYFAASHD